MVLFECSLQSSIVIFIDFHVEIELLTKFWPKNFGPKALFKLPGEMFYVLGSPFQILPWQIKSMANYAKKVGLWSKFIASHDKSQYATARTSSNQGLQ